MPTRPRYRFPKTSTGAFLFLKNQNFMTGAAGIVYNPAAIECRKMQQADLAECNFGAPQHHEMLVVIWLTREIRAPAADRAA